MHGHSDPYFNYSVCAWARCIHVLLFYCNELFMEAEKCNLAAARRPFNFRMRRHLLRVRRASSARRRTFSACGELAPHAEVVCWRADTQLRMRRYLLDVRRPCSACGGIVLTCRDLFFQPSQSSRFITPPALIVASSLACLTS